MATQVEPRIQNSLEPLKKGDECAERGAVHVGRKTELAPRAELILRNPKHALQRLNATTFPEIIPSKDRRRLGPLTACAYTIQDARLKFHYQLICRIREPAV